MANALLLGQASNLGDQLNPNAFGNAFNQAQTNQRANQEAGQQNALFQMKQDEYQRNVAEQQKQKQLEGVREDLATFLKFLPDDNARTQAWQGGLAQHYGADPNSDWHQEVGNFIRKNPGVLGPEVSAKVLTDYFVPKEPPHSVQEYQFAQKGGYRGTYADWMRQQKTAVQQFKLENPSGPAPDSPFDKETQKTLAKQMPSIQQAGIGAQSDLVKVGGAETGLSSAFTGTGAAAKEMGARAANFLTGGAAFGKELKATEDVKSFLSESALEARNPAGGAGMPGAMSDQDRKFLTDLAGRIDNQTARLDEVIKVRKAIDQRKIAIADAANQYVKEHGKLDAGFYNVVQAIGAQPLLSGIGESPQKPQAPSTGGPAAGDIQGGYRFKGGDPGKQENWEPVVQ